MASFKKILVVSFISASLIVVPIRSARAIVPLVIPWLLVGSNLLVTDLVVGQVGVLAALFWWDCNKFALSAPCTTKTPMPAAQLPKPALTVNLKPDAKRENPDPKKFNDPAAGSGQRDVTPKAVIAASGKAAPTTAVGIPGVPVGPQDIGQYTQAPRETNVGTAGVDPAIQLAQYNGSVARGGPVTGIEVVPQKSPAPPKAIPFIALHTTCAANTDCIAPLRANEQYLGQFNGGKFINTASIECCTGTMRYVSIAYLYDQATEVTTKCDAGYVLSGTYVGGEAQCNLTDAAAVKKPVDTPCEMLFDPATRQIMTDPANLACSGMSTSTELSVDSADGQSSLDVKANAGNGFDVCINKADGGKTCFDTGVYDPGTGGYVIVHTTITPPPDPNNGLGCGGPGQGVCSAVANSNSDMQEKDAASRASIDQANIGLKGKMDNIDPNKFQWSFIPQIPTTACVNPSVRNPVTGGSVEMDICGGFNKFTFFLNAVLAVACVYGCVRQVQNAMKA